MHIWLFISLFTVSLIRLSTEIHYQHRKWRYFPKLEGPAALWCPQAAHTPQSQMLSAESTHPQADLMWGGGDTDCFPEPQTAGAETRLLCGVTPKLWQHWSLSSNLNQNNAQLDQKCILIEVTQLSTNVLSSGLNTWMALCSEEVLLSALVYWDLIIYFNSSVESTLPSG